MPVALNSRTGGGSQCQKHHVPGADPGRQHYAMAAALAAPETRHALLVEGAAQVGINLNKKLPSSRCAWNSGRVKHGHLQGTARAAVMLPIGQGVRGRRGGSDT